MLISNNQTDIPKVDQTCFLELECSKASTSNCPFKLYFRKKKNVQTFSLECFEFEEHNHELVIDRDESSCALQRLDFCPPDNRSHKPLTLQAFYEQRQKSKIDILRMQKGDI